MAIDFAKSQPNLSFLAGSAYQDQCILDFTTFVTVEGFAKLRTRPKDFFGTHMLRILSPVVSTDPEPKVYREAAEFLTKSTAYNLSTSGLKFSASFLNCQAKNGV